MATILIVDDREENRSFLTTLLSFTNHTSFEAENAQTALELVYTQHPDLIITDILMPEVDGFEFVRQLRADPATRATRVIFYSATFIEPATHELARACGVEHILAKPAPPEQILSTIQEVLGTSTIIVPFSPTDDFDKAHLRILLDKLTQKVDELEAMNADLERRVAARTAELADANNYLRTMDTLKDNLLAMASHDLRSPLSAIQMAVELLMDEEQLSDEGREIGQTIFGAINRLVELVNNVLDVSSLESGQMSLKRQQIDASLIVFQTIEVLESHAKAKAIDLRFERSMEEVQLLADPLRLSQICNNLISNAIKFTPLGGSVVVQIACEGDEVALHVSDTGVGISAEALPTIFKKFQQSHAYGTANEKGSGLGLSIVHQLVELHGGRITIASTPGQGSTFSVYLPRQLTGY